MLRVTDLHVYYGMIRAVKGVSFEINKGEIVTLIGANGAGKTTILRTISGLEKITRGSIEFLGNAITNKMPAHKLVQAGIAHVPEGRRVFSTLTVQQNLALGAILRKDEKAVHKNIEYVFSLFPRLKERSNQPAGTLSGGEQQMLAIGRALMTQGQLLLLDEPSMGLAPLVVESIFNIIEKLNKSGMTILLIEQNANMALNIANRAYVLRTGEIIKSGNAQQLLNDPEIMQAYLGI
ncbi:MAG: ABC transporter ATP-binding protein [Treponema sp.]|nr:ABC transporter ATP-binding protein [Treponema sp.]